MQAITHPAGASETSLAEVERAYGIALPHELRRFWADSDGPILWFGFKELQFLCLADIRDDMYSVRKQMPGALPLCMDGYSNICVARFEAGRVSGFHVAPCDDLDWESAVRISESFEEFLNDDLSPRQRLDA
jgi:SMI1 / KNR4 family (SUKH-1)